MGTFHFQLCCGLAAVGEDLVSAYVLLGGVVDDEDVPLAVLLEPVFGTGRLAGKFHAVLYPGQTDGQTGAEPQRH